MPSALSPVIGATQLGPLPWARLWSLPLARSAEPVRLMLFGYLVLAIILAVWLAIPAKSRLLRAARWILGLAAVAAIIAYIPARLHGNVIPAWSARRRPRGRPWPCRRSSAAASTGTICARGEIVVVVSDRGNAGMLFQADTNFYFRIAGGFINAALSDTTALPAPVGAQGPDPGQGAAVPGVRPAAGVGAIIVERAWAAPWMQIFSRMGLHGTLGRRLIVYRTA